MNRVLLILKWLLMWSCDVVPWVSGGTIAFVTGIYDELIDALHGFNIETIKLLFKWKIKQVWQNIHWNFLVSVFGWIFIAILTLSKLISYLLETYPVLIWSFFFGLIIASAIILRKSIKKHKMRYLLLLLIWVVIGFLVTWLPVLNLGSGNLTMFASWAIAIIAMILPWISGSYILVILWQYQEVLWNVVSLTGWDIQAIWPILIFMWWAVVWLLSFAKLLHWIKAKRHDQMVIVLIWFMLWSLNKVRPWKETVETFVDRHGEIQPLVQNNIMPVFSTEVITAISIALFGFVVVVWVDYLAKKLKK